VKGAPTPGSLRLLTVGLLLLALLASVVARLWLDPQLLFFARAVCGLAFVASLVAFAFAIAAQSGAGGALRESRAGAGGPRNADPGRTESPC
jgi:hypothetical protein